MHLNTNIDNYDFYIGKTPQEVIKKHDDNQRSWSLSLFSTKKSNKLKINPFEDICIGVYVYNNISNLYKYTMSIIQTREWNKVKRKCFMLHIIGSYTHILLQIGIDISELLLMLLGILTFWSAHKLSGNPLFYYITCITLGVSTSIIILVYFFSKFLLRVNVIFMNSFHLHIFYNNISFFEN